VTGAASRVPLKPRFAYHTCLWSRSVRLEPTLQPAGPPISVAGRQAREFGPPAQGIRWHLKTLGAGSKYSQEAFPQAIKKSGGGILHLTLWDWGVQAGSAM
jgi:hypothetical protein